MGLARETISASAFIASLLPLSHTQIREQIHVYDLARMEVLLLLLLLLSPPSVENQQTNLRSSQPCTDCKNFYRRELRYSFRFIIIIGLSCYRLSPQNRSPQTICGKLCCRRWSPRTIYGCHGWSPRTICGAVSGPPWPQMVPLKLSLEMMSHGIYS